MRNLTLKIALSITFIALCIHTASALETVKWSSQIINAKSDNPAIEISVSISPGYHLYSPSNPPGGATPLSINFFNIKGVKLIGEPVANKKYIVQYSDVFLSDEHFFTGNVKFVQKLKPTEKNFSLDLEIKGQVCIEGACMPVFYSHNLKGESAVAAAEINDDMSDYIENLSSETEENRAVDDTVEPAVVDKSQTWSNVEAELGAYNGNAALPSSMSLWYILIAGFIGGLLALVTPCVWPMIPMTVSYFLKQQGASRRKQIAGASAYGASIVVIYVGLGLLITVLFGASALNSLATNAIFNIIFFAILVLFAISFMGGFEMTLPASWSNKVDSRIGVTTGYLSIFFMAFTLVLVSFSCTGPIIGTLLVEAATTSNFLSPAVGMTGFALALALPFTLFALFPSWLKAVPKSGGWLNSVKVVLGFLELALALKFLSVADMAYGWRILDREVFIALWIAIFGLLGIYLLGKITFSHDSKVERIGVFRFMLALISLSFALYMVPGLWGAPLKAISAFTPPTSTQDFSLYDGNVHPQTDDFDKAMQLSVSSGKPVLLDFSGYGCVNCRKMEAAVWTNPNVKQKIDDDFVLVTLMVDDKKQLSTPIQVVEKDGSIRTLRTVGDKWSYLQRSKFGANAQPYHVILNSQGMPLASPYTYNEDPGAYLKWLTSIYNK